MTARRVWWLSSMNSEQSTKRCARCANVLPLTDFGMRKAPSGNLVARAYCRPCASAKAMEAYDPEKAKKSYQRRRQQDPERFRAYSRKQYWKDPESKKQRAKQWRRKNAERVLDYAKNYKTAHRAEATVWENARRAKIKNSTVVSFTTQQLEQRMSMFPGCWMCGGPKEQVDHVKPLAKGGMHVLSNLRPACGSCNRSKKDKWPFVGFDA